MTIKINLTNIKKPVQARIPLKISKTLDGNLLIDDHECMDIVVNPAEGKVITLPKPYAEKEVYEYQRDLLHHLFKGGVMDASHPQGGPVFGMVEATYPLESKSGVDSLQTVLFLINDYIKRTSGDEDVAKEYDKNIEDKFVDPDETETTEPGKIPPYEENPEAYQIGDPTYAFAGYGYYY